MNLLMLGCGKMGGALLRRWIEGGDSFTIVDPGLDEPPVEGTTLVSKPEELGETRFDAIIIAIKPQMIDELLPRYTQHLEKDAYALSIAAGASIERIETLLGGTPTVRVMPNLPASIGQGVSGICFSAKVSEAQQAHASGLMKLAGTLVAVESEDGLDRFTAIAGSGPGYVFEFARCYVEAAKGLGFDEEQARQMVLGTIAGTVAMASESDEPLDELRNSVTSKGGTTAAGLDAFNGKGDLAKLLSDTAASAYRRAVELR